MTCPSSYKTIKIGINNTDISSYNISDYIETIEITRIVDNTITTTTEQFVSLYIAPENYKRQVEYADLDMFAWGNLPDLRSEVSKITLNIDYSESNLLRAIDAVNRYHIENGLRLNILDYVNVNPTDYITSKLNNTVPFTERFGIFNYENYDGETGNSINANSYRPSGVNLIFLELPEVYKSLVINGVTYYVVDTEYQTTIENNPTNLVTASKGSFLDKSLVRLGFTATLDYSSIDLYRNLLTYAKNAITTNTPITIEDNINPQGYTSRTGFLKIPFTVRGGVRIYPNTNISYLPKGFEISFVETKLRYA